MPTKLEGVIIQLQKRNGHEMLSFAFEGKHYVGFLEEKKRVNSQYKIPFISKGAKIRLCDYEKCNFCLSKK